MEILTSAITAFILTVILIPISIPLSKKFGLVDDPKKRFHPAHTQNRIVPRAGGLSIYLSIIISMLLFLPMSQELIGIILGATVLLIIGLLDDILPSFNPYLRLGLLFLAAAFPVFAGVGISFVTNPFSLLSIINPHWSNAYINLDKLSTNISFLNSNYTFLLADIFSFFWIVTLTQIINWSKGVDGQMPGITLVASATLGFLSLKFFWQGDQNQLEVAELSFIVAATSLGFLIYNWHPAKIFPGFSGSTILAFMLAILSILSGAKLATALLVLAVPSADFIFTILRRISSGHSPVWGDRGHLHHKLLDLGWSHQTISLFYISVSAIFGILALSIDIQSKAFVALGIIIVIMGLILWLNSFGDLSKH